MIDEGATGAELIRYLQNALAIADELKDRKTGHLIEQALSHARSGAAADGSGRLLHPKSR
jgi:hypothetical protein